jgi:hypothetical protein
MDNAVSNSQRGRDEPVSVRGQRCILAQVQRQFGEHGALDFVKVVICCWHGSRTSREVTAISMVRLRWPRLASEPRLIHAHVPMPLSALGSSAARTRTIATSFTLNAYSCMGPDFGPALTHHPLVRVERHVVQNNGQLNSLWRDSPGMRPGGPFDFEPRLTSR